MKILLDNSFNIAISGLFSILIAGAIFYFETRSVIAYALFAAGFVFIGIGLLLALFKAVTQKED